jgi:hypothetical protein
MLIIDNLSYYFEDLRLYDADSLAGIELRNLRMFRSLLFVKNDE